MWYFIIFIALIASEIMILGSCFIEEVLLCGLIGFILFKKRMLFYGLR